MLLNKLLNKIICDEIIDTNKQKNSIQFLSIKYKCNINIIQNNNEVIVNFNLMDENKSFAKEYSKSISVKINDIKDFLFNYYEELSLIKNKKMIEEIGFEKYTELKEKNINTLRNLEEISLNHNIKTITTKEKYNLIITNEKLYEDSILCINEDVSIPKGLINAIDIDWVHLIKNNVNNLEHYEMKMLLPILKVDNYPYLKRSHPVINEQVNMNTKEIEANQKQQEISFFEDLRKNTKHNELGILLSYIIMDENMIVKPPEKKIGNKRKI